MIDIKLQSKLQQFKYYRDIQLWPLSTDFNFDEWINNFDAEEKEIAIRLLDFFVFFPDKAINQMLATVIGKCGYYFLKNRGSWSNEEFKTNCWYSFVPGEEQKPTDSGYIFQRKLRDNIGIPERRIISYNDLHNQLSSSYNQNIILVDDFVGSGHQTCVAWLYNRPSGRTLKELVEDNGHCVVYAPLVANYIGKKAIEQNCNGLGLVYVHEILKDSNIFSQECPCWDGDEDLYKRGVELIIRKSLELGIPETNGNNVIDIKGYREQGLALAFAHGIPDACPPIFYWETSSWKPLMNRVYQRP